jgi:signal transduction histidine kinase
MPSFHRLSVSDLGCPSSKEYVAKLMDAFDALKRDRGRNLAPFLQLLFQNETRVHLRAFMYRFEDWFFGGFVDDMSRLQAEGTELLSAGNLEGLKTIGNGFQGQYDKGADYLDQMKKVREWIRSILEQTEAGRPYRNDWKGFIMRAQTLGHDYGNFLMVALLKPVVDISMIERVKDGKTIEELKDMMKPFDVSSTSSIIEMIINMSRKSAKEAGVALDRTLVDDVVLPYQYRAAYFRICYELIRNAIKYHDDSKKDRFVKVTSERTDKNFVVTVNDNGVGIGDLEEAIKWGYRERPELAPGTGVGLANIKKLAEENGWKVEMNSKLGEGTEMKLMMGIIRNESGLQGGAMGADGFEDGFGTSVLVGSAGSTGVTGVINSTYGLAGVGAFLVAGLA